MTNLLKTDREIAALVDRAVKECLDERDRTNQEANSMPMNDGCEIRIEGEIRSLLEADHPQGVRQVFYEAVASGILPKNENTYPVLVRLLDDLRQNGRIPEGWILAPSR
jgi:hypothetical protein